MSIACVTRKEILEATKLSWIGFHGHNEMNYNRRYRWKKDASCFESGTRASADIADIDFGIKWLKQIGFDKINLRVQRLSKFTFDLANKSKLKILSVVNEKNRSGILIIRLPTGFSGWDLCYKLPENDHILTSPVCIDFYLKIAIHFFYTKDEIRTIFIAIKKYCGLYPRFLFKRN